MVENWSHFCSLYPGPVPIARDTTPLSLDEATRALYNRAISDPSSLTDQGRRRITYRPPPEEENALYRDLKEQAMRAATTDDIRAATEVATDVQKLWTVAQVAARKALNWDDIRNIMVAMKVPCSSSSSSSVGDSGSSSPSEAGGLFGLVVFYPENKEDEKEGQGRLALYKSEIRTAIYHSLHYSPLLIKDKTRNRFALHWLAVPTTSGSNDNNNNFQDPSALRSRFRTMLSNNEIPRGLRRDAFLCPESNPEHEAGIGAGAQPPLPPLKVGIKHIAPTLFARFVQRNLQGEARRKPYRYTSELSRLHEAT
ncbi:hypothetical protein BJX63DRAFT_423455 [Aspergillus granulosus]|uniref:Uncharacterized protein n=1 Tax=Aspergillus granulosus TaxID=176169 RepID=A0ABR4H564_9EURO